MMGSDPHGSPAASGVGVSRQGVELINEAVQARAAQEGTWRAFQVCPHCQTAREIVAGSRLDAPRRPGRSRAGRIL